MWQWPWSHHKNKLSIMPNNSAIHTAGVLWLSASLMKVGELINRVQLIWVPGDGGTDRKKWLTVSRTGYGHVFTRPKPAVSISVTITAQVKMSSDKETIQSNECRNCIGTWQRGSMENPAQHQYVILTVKYIKTEKKQQHAPCITMWP
jgi:hypothetical protein